MLANRNGFFYVLDRATGKLLLAKPFTATTWAREIGAGRPPDRPQRRKQGLSPGSVGRHEFQSAVVRRVAASVPRRRARDVRDLHAAGAAHRSRPPGRMAASSTSIARSQPARCARSTRATGQRRWEFAYASPAMSGVLSTASGLVFAGDNEGNFMAFDTSTGRNLWRYQTGNADLGRGADDLQARRAPACARFRRGRLSSRSPCSAGAWLKPDDIGQIRVYR